MDFTAVCAFGAIRYQLMNSNDPNNPPEALQIMKLRNRFNCTDLNKLEICITFLKHGTTFRT